jgi:hypothetical protein
MLCFKEVTCLKMSSITVNPDLSSPWLMSNKRAKGKGKGKGKFKGIQLKAWTGKEVSRRLRLPDFKTIGT